ncbi:MAG TPA: hypothetical protein VNV36_05305 [Pseudomonas sp.]|uniref:hypothetical protein n=1 Tax=Pseudomonas sp. TaxID=306 RepID=UPI002C65D6C5|nr:hypothetical protein [Pseudomonas sp.]HWH86179.1 hypothetical protein [Pseudomonas sp.]
MSEKRHTHEQELDTLHVVLTQALPAAARDGRDDLPALAIQCAQAVRAGYVELPKPATAQFSIDLGSLLSKVEKTVEQLPSEKIPQFIDDVERLLSTAEATFVTAEDNSAAGASGGRVYRFDVVGIDELCAAALAQQGPTS